MGANTNPQQPATPAQQQLMGLRSVASTPYQGSAPGGGGAQGAAQLVAALLARKKAQQLGIPVYGVQGAQPGAVTPGSLAPSAVSSGAGSFAQAPQTPMNPGLPSP
jgi:hypothetical protein